MNFTSDKLLVSSTMPSDQFTRTVQDRDNERVSRTARPIGLLPVWLTPA